MFYRSSCIAPTSRRPGVVLLVVMAMLALFASLALSFVFYADAEAVAAGYSMNAQQKSDADIDPELLASYFLSQLIYDANNPYSAMRGWSLARSMYGNNPGTLNFTPFNGIGRTAVQSTMGSESFAPGGPVPHMNLINYQKFESSTPIPGDPLLNNLRMPEFAQGATIANAAWAANVAAITTGTPHGLSVGQPVLISKVSVAAYNGLFTVTNVGSPTTFQYSLPSTVAVGPSATGIVSRYVGGANSPWTAYDTNNIFLAQVDANGNVLMPSYMRPWITSIGGSPSSRYTSLFIDSTWNPAFNTPDLDASGLQVKNLDLGPGMNDSNWIDLGFPVMTAPNGKRYKPLFAPLVLDLSNKLHLWAHGNRLGGTAAVPKHVSNIGFGGHEVNLSSALGVTIVSATENAAGTVTITTATPHGLAAGQSVIISNCTVAGYNGTYTVLAAPAPTATTFSYTNPTLGLGASAGGLALPLNELQALFALKFGSAGVPVAPSATIALATEAGGTVTITTSAAHGFRAGQRVAIQGVGVPGYTGIYTITAVGPAATRFQYQLQTTAALAASGGGTAVLVPYLPPGTGGSTIDADGLNTSTGLSSRPFYMTMNLMTAGSITPALPAVVPPGGLSRTVTVSPTTGTSGGFPWYFFEAVPAVFPQVVVGGELVTVTAANPAAGTFTATFNQTHPVAGNPIVFGSYSSFPTFPASWGNTAGEVANHPLMFNLTLPGAPNIAPLPMSNQEALLRWGATNSPALTSEIFRRMPATFSNIRARQMITLANSYMDRVTAPPYINYDRNAAAPIRYGHVAGTPYPTPGNEVQSVAVAGKSGTFKLQIPGHAQTAAIPYNAPAATVQAALTATLAAGEAVSVSTIPGPPTTTYTVMFGGTLANRSVGPMAQAGIGGATVTVTLVRPGQALVATPNSATPSSAVTSLGSEFAPDWRSRLAQALRVDLSRPLKDFPPAAPGTGLIANTAAGSPFDLAQRDRQQFAKDLYNALIRVTGTRDPNVNAGMTPTAFDYQAARWLAQLAANIVDYIDNDDFCTPFNWNPTVAAPEGWVFGVELPRLVLNEAYAQQETNGTVNVWAELYNPYKASAAATFPVDLGNAILQRTTAVVANPPYIIEIHAKDAALDTALQDPANSTGFLTTPLNTQANWGTTATTTRVLPGANGPGSVRVVKTIAAAPTGATAAGTTVTITTTAGHGFTVGGGSPDIGKPVTISGIADPAYAPGTYLITAVPSATSFRYVDTGIAGVVPPSGGGTITYGPNSNQSQGFYVIGPAGAPYGDNAHNPKLLASYLSPTGMSFTRSTQKIALRTATPPGASHGVVDPVTGTTATITLHAGPPQDLLPAAVAVGDSVRISGVRPGNGYNGVFQVKSIAADRKSFTYDIPQPQAGTLPGGAGVTSGSPNAVNWATVSIPLPQGVTLLLRRLANPHLPFNPAAGATYNPYITVDQFGGVPVNSPDLPPPNATVGRAQPYGGAQVGVLAPDTFFTHNVPGMNYNWLVHLDRPPVNPLELLYVSGCRPHELTQKFASNGHIAPWADANTMIYRLLDQTSTHYAAGLTTGGRFQGNVNLNTIMEREVFRALCDPHDQTGLQYPTPWYTQADVDSVFAKMITARTAINSSGEPSSPFKSFSAAKTVGTAPINNVTFDESWFRLDAATGQPVFAVGPGSAHPYLRASLLQKAYNNISTTSNTFAVWWTVGYFEVVDETVRPQKLGQEIGRSQNRHIRHRFFAIVDRSGLQLFNTTSTSALTDWVAATTYAAGTNVIYNGKSYISLAGGNTGNVPTNAAFWSTASTMSYNAALTNVSRVSPITSNGMPITVQPGMLLEIDTDRPNAEVVLVQAVGVNNFTATFTRPHAAGAPIICRGNPGPQAVYNPHDDPNVVLHMSVIK